MRITIVGLPGSGKSYLAKKIAEKNHIPYIHIDRFWLEGGGGQNSRTTPNPEKTHAYVKEKVLDALQAESWVSDGMYSKIQPEIANRADTIIFLDIPLWQRLFNHARRIFNRSKRHKEVSFLGDLLFFFEMVGRESAKKSKIYNFLEKCRAKTIVLKSRKEIGQYIQTLS